MDIDKLFEKLIKHRVLVLGISILLTLIMSFFAVKVQLNTDFSTYFSEDDPVIQEFNRVGETFGSNYLGLAIIKKDAIFTEKNLVEIDNLQNSYNEIDGILRVMSIVDMIDETNADPKSFPSNDGELEEFKNAILEQEMYEGNFINDELTAAIILISFDPDANHIEVANQVEEVTSQLSSTPDDVYFGGMPFMMSAFQTTILSNLTVLMPVMLLVLVAILYIGFRTVAGMLLPLLIVIVSSIWLIGIVSLFGYSLDMLSGIVPVILVAMGSADGIHFLRKFYELRSEKIEVYQAVKESAKEMSLPIFLTTITTMIGFASLASSNFEVIRQFGLITTLGVFLALVVTFILLPPILSFTKDKQHQKNQQHSLTEHKALNSLSHLIYYRRKTVLFFTVAILAVSLYGVTKIESDVDWSLCFSKGSKPYEADILLREEFSGSMFAQVLVKGELNDPITLQVMKNTGKYMSTLPEVSQANSLAEVFSEASYSATGLYAIPNSRDDLETIWESIKGQQVLDGIVEPANQEFLITGKVSTMSTAAMSNSVNDIDQYVQENAGDWVKVNKYNADISSDMKDQLIDVQVNRIVTNLLLDLEVEGVSFDRGELKDIIETAMDKITMTDEFSNLVALEEAFYQLEEKVPSNLLENKLLHKKISGELSSILSPYIFMKKQELDSIDPINSIEPDRITNVDLQQTGMVTVLNQMEEELTPTQIKSVALALVVVFILMSFIFKSITIGFIGIIPIILTVLVNFGVLGYMKIGLDSFTAMIASISIGLGIDYAIHFTTRFRKEMKNNSSQLQALKNTLQTTGVAIILNTISVGSGFALLLFAAGQHLQRFGGLLTLALFMSAIFTLVVLPVLTLMLKPNYMKEK